MRPIFVCLSLLLFLASCQAKTTIANSIPEREANEIIVLLASKGVEAVKSAAPASTVGGATAKETMWNIAVPSNQITQSLAILNQAGLPKIKGTRLLDLFGDKGLVPSDMQDRIRYQEGLSEQLAMTIRKMDGIIDANVQITFPSSEEEGEIPMTASVYVKHRGVLDNPNSLMITKIKRLVSSALPGLKLENVTVVADRAIYSDISLPELSTLPDYDKEYISIWSVVVAKDSASRFRVIFYFFLILFFIFVCAIAWLFWKLYPIIQVSGYQFLLSLKQTPPSSEQKKEEIHEEESEDTEEEEE